MSYNLDNFQFGYGVSRLWDLGQQGSELHQPAPSGASGNPAAQEKTDDANGGDVTMLHPAETGGSVTRATSRVTPRAKYTHLNWSDNKARIQEIYIKQDKTLKETRQIMADVYGFEASEKLFKEKFKLWGWQKNLPADKAAFMVRKARQRKLEAGKDTVFKFGGQEWDSDRAGSTVSRAKMRCQDNPPENVPTPQGIQYETPVVVVTPSNASIARDDDEMQWSDTDTEDQEDPATDGQDIFLTWEGLSATDFLAISGYAATCLKDGRVQEAENHYRRALEGLHKITGRTSEKCREITYSLATLYAESARFADALAVIEELIQGYVETLGFHAKKTQQLVLEVVELLNSWNRQDDAMMLLSRAQEILASKPDQTTKRQTAKGRARRQKMTQSREAVEGSDSVAAILQTILSSHDRQPIDHGLNVARARVAAKDKAAQQILRAIISQCEKRPLDFAKENLMAHAELLKLHEHLGTAQEKYVAFQQAEAALEKTWESQLWKNDFTSFEVMEASLQLAANSLKGGYSGQAYQMFSDAADKANEVFGFMDERTVWVSITIGLVYQTHTSWGLAEPWFERALASALANDNWGPDDGIGSTF
ncbi:hypothetical protein S7711_06917 [Stachybotrys chartarum IBT 7711]|uniref:Clr5 domain-containing protein n=1 Tax=Stachybotrys chartarum (strain CBS 109288 / IBT 7711) TaxID=1280523 RepID=A0A084AL30_STACB|nr:hypothetical protein S7711_06917 [Stachybotrys chartarum IBT 7711]